MGPGRHLSLKTAPAWVDQDRHLQAVQDLAPRHRGHRRAAQHRRGHLRAPDRRGDRLRRVRLRAPGRLRQRRARECVRHLRRTLGVSPSRLPGRRPARSAPPTSRSSTSPVPAATRWRTSAGRSCTSASRTRTRASPLGQAHRLRGDRPDSSRRPASGTPRFPSNAVALAVQTLDQLETSDGHAALLAVSDPMQTPGGSRSVGRSGRAAGSGDASPSGGVYRGAAYAVARGRVRALRSWPSWSASPSTPLPAFARFGPRLLLVGHVEPG